MKIISKLTLACVAALSLAACNKDNPAKKTITPQPVITVDGQFPILSWTGIDASDSGRKFGPMKECGINVYLGWYDKLSDVMLTLDNAEKAGVKCILRSDELFDDTEAAVAAMKDHPALLAYEIKDEPEVGDFEELAGIVKKIQELDPNHPCYINLYPNWAWGGPGSYLPKVLDFLVKVPVKFLSFDYYPIVILNGEQQLRPYWYKNLEDIRIAARARKMPFWAFALSLSHTLSASEVYPIPTVEELRLQQFSNLVYGATGFQYFTHWGIYQNGPTNVYDRVKTVNAELQSLAPYFLGATIDDVKHIGKEIPYGTKRLKEMPEGVKSLEMTEGGAVVSMFSNKEGKFIALVNRSYDSSATFQIAFTSSATQIDHDANKSAASDGSYTLTAGDIIIFKI